MNMTPAAAFDPYKVLFAPLTISIDSMKDGSSSRKSKVLEKDDGSFTLGAPGKPSRLFAVAALAWVAAVGKFAPVGHHAVR